METFIDRFASAKFSQWETPSLKLQCNGNCSGHSDTGFCKRRLECVISIDKDGKEPDFTPEIEVKSSVEFSGLALDVICKSSI